MVGLSNGFLRQTSKDYDVAQFHVEVIAKKSINYKDFYNKLEQYVSDRAAILSGGE